MLQYGDRLEDRRTECVVLRDRVWRSRRQEAGEGRGDKLNRCSGRPIGNLQESAVAASVGRAQPRRYCATDTDYVCMRLSPYRFGRGAYGDMVDVETRRRIGESRAFGASRLCQTWQRPRRAESLRAREILPEAFDRSDFAIAAAKLRTAPPPLHALSVGDRPRPRLQPEQEQSPQPAAQPRPRPRPIGLAGCPLGMGRLTILIAENARYVRRSRAVVCAAAGCRLGRGKWLATRLLPHVQSGGLDRYAEHHSRHSLSS